MSEAADIYVLGTSAWLTLIEDESEADTVQQLLERARTGEIVVLAPFMSFMAVYYVSLQERDWAEAGQRVQLMAAMPGSLRWRRNVTRPSSTRILNLSRLRARFRL